MKHVDLALLILRCTIGLMLIPHGFNKVRNGIDGTARWFESMGMKPGKLHAYLAAATEMGGGAILALGFLTPLAASSAVSLMLVAIVTAHRKNGFFIFKPGQGWEYCAVVAATALAAGTLGGGRWSLDNAFDITFSGWNGFWITLIVGAGSATGLLAVFWRPPAAAPAATPAKA